MKLFGFCGPIERFYYFSVPTFNVFGLPDKTDWNKYWKKESSPLVNSLAKMMALEPWWNDLAHPEIAEAAKANQD